MRVCHPRLQHGFSLIITSLLAAVAVGGDSAAPANPSPTTLPSDAATVETVVIFRHGEKPANGLGQLTPQGFNRALAISTVLPAKFGKPDYLFAPDPREKVSDRGGLFSYVRPLATIEPLAVRLGMPIQTPCGFRDIGELNAELANERYAGRIVFVAWEHVYAQRAATELVKTFGGDASKVPSWGDGDYDSLYVERITRTPGHPTTITFELDHEGLDGQSLAMPSPAAK